MTTVWTPPGATVWLTGLPSAGKSTLAEAAAEQLHAAGRAVEVLDGDAIRKTLSTGLGFSREDRRTNVFRIGFVARLLASHGVIVLAPVIAPFADARRSVRAHHEEHSVPYLEVYVATPVDVCAQRDVKGLYARQAAGLLTGLTGVDDVYEPPEMPDLCLDTVGESTAQSAQRLLSLLAERRIIAAHGKDSLRRLDRA